MCVYNNGAREKKFNMLCESFGFNLISLFTIADVERVYFGGGKRNFRLDLT